MSNSTLKPMSQMLSSALQKRMMNIACRRIEQAQAQGTLLPPEKPPEPVQEGLL